MSTVLILAAAVAISTGGSTLMKVSDGLRRRGPAVGALALYSVAILLFAVLARRMPIAQLYAVWGGLSVVTATIVGRVVFAERLSARQLAGLLAIGTGVMLLSVAR